jgi:hypothetical protein
MLKHTKQPQRLQQQQQHQQQQQQQREQVHSQQQSNGVQQTQQQQLQEELTEDCLKFAMELETKHAVPQIVIEAIAAKFFDCKPELKLYGGHKVYYLPLAGLLKTLFKNKSNVDWIDSSMQRQSARGQYNDL